MTKLLLNQLYLLCIFDPKSQSRWRLNICVWRGGANPFIELPPLNLFVSHANVNVYPVYLLRFCVRPLTLKLYTYLAFMPLSARGQLINFGITLFLLLQTAYYPNHFPSYLFVNQNSSLA